MKSILLLALTGLAAAQEPVVQDPVAPSPKLSGFDRALAPEIQAMSFVGGSLNQFAETLIKARSANIILSDLAHQAQVPSMELKNVSIEAALRTACRAVHEPFRASLEVTASNVGGKVGGQPIFYVRVDREKAPAKAALNAFTAAPEVRVFSLQYIAAGASEGPKTPVASVLTAIDTGLGMVAETAPPNQTAAKATVRFHQDSNLLFVAGTPAQIDVVQQVLTQLERHRAQAEHPAGTAKPPAPAKDVPGEPAKSTGIR